MDMDRIFIIDENILEKLKTEIAESVIKALQSNCVLQNHPPPEPDWVDGPEAKHILGFRSKSKMQQLRDSGVIVYSKFGKKLKYQRQSLIEYIEINKRT